MFLGTSQAIFLYLLALPRAKGVRPRLETMGQYPDQVISLFDAITASMAKREDGKLLTFDRRHFRLLGAKIYG